MAPAVQGRFDDADGDRRLRRFYRRRHQVRQSAALVEKSAPEYSSRAEAPKGDGGAIQRQDGGRKGAGEYKCLFGGICCDFDRQLPANFHR